MADVLLDTTVFIDYWRGDPEARRLIESVLDGTLTASTSAMTAFELWLGALTGEEESIYDALFAVIEEAPLTAAAAKRAAQWLKETPPRAPERLIRDALIAATAAERSETIYTRNVSDFRRFYPNVQSY